MFFSFSSFVFFLQSQLLSPIIPSSHLVSFCFSIFNFILNARFCFALLSACVSLSACPFLPFFLKYLFSHLYCFLSSSSRTSFLALYSTHLSSHFWTLKERPYTVSVSDTVATHTHTRTHPCTHMVSGVVFFWRWCALGMCLFHCCLTVWHTHAHFDYHICCQAQFTS